jgi:hypothetical protein
LVAVPTFESVEPEAYEALWRLSAPADFKCVKGYDCAAARNEIAKAAINGGYDRLLMVDSDVIVPPDTLDILAPEPLSVCLGVYTRKHTKTGVVELVGASEDDYTNPYKAEELKQLPDRFEVRGGGMGCAMFDVDVFGQLPFPWFAFAMYPNGDTLSEDFYFCERMRQAGLKVYADKRCKCGHIGKRVQVVT